MQAQHDPIPKPVEPARVAPARSATRAPVTAKRSRRPPIQAKLDVGSVDDPLERDADLVAQRVVASLRNVEPDDAGGDDDVDGARIRRSASGTAVHRSSTERDGTARIRRSGTTAVVRPRIDGIGRIQRAAIVGAEGGTLDDATERALQSARSGGRALDGDLQRSMGDAMGADLSEVRVHTGSTSDALNARLGARAFTSGNDVFFRGGMPDASSASGLNLIAHEVAHTVQQGASPVRRAPEETAAAPAEAPASSPSAAAAAPTQTSETPAPNSVPEELSGTIPTVEVAATPEAVMGRLPLQEDATRSRVRRAVRAAGSGSGERVGRVIPVDATFSTGSRIRRVDRVAEGARDDQGVGRAITYGSAITGTLAASAFGAMQPAASFKDIVWEWADGKIQIDATLFGTFDWGVNNGGRIDISDPTSSVITADNYAEIAADLTPKLEGGSWRPSRFKYWSSALTSRHEMYHATDSDQWFQSEGPGIARAYLKRTPIVLNWYERWMPSTVKVRVEAALNGAIGEMYKQYTTYMRADMDQSGYLNFPGEIRAFGDGKVPYQTLATGVDTHGKKLAAAAAPPPTATPTATPSTPPTTPTGTATPTPVTSGTP